MHAVDVVRAWQEAVNSGDLKRLLELSEDQIEMIGPHGRGRGADLLDGWLERSGFSGEIRQIFARGSAVVVMERGTWRNPGSGAISGAGVALAFAIAGARVARFARFDDLGAALNHAGLSEADLVWQLEP